MEKIKHKDCTICNSHGLVWVVESLGEGATLSGNENCTKCDYWEKKED